MALWYGLKHATSLQAVVVIICALLTLTSLITVWHRNRLLRKRVHALFFLIFAAVLTWWLALQPSNNRQWADEVAHMATFEISGDTATVHNVRNFTWRSLTDYNSHWETRSYDLSKLNSVDLFLSNWGTPHISHTMVSFGFTTGEYVTFSLEIRKEYDESFSPIAGFFRQYELALIAATEEDILYTRTNIRKEDVTRYTIMLPPEQHKSLFLEYASLGNKLARKPSFYNTLTANCTTVVFQMAQAIMPALPADYRLLFSGMLPTYLYEIGGLEHKTSLEQLTSEGHITERVQGLADAHNYSLLIRQQ